MLWQTYVRRRYRVATTMGLSTYISVPLGNMLFTKVVVHFLQA